MQKISKQPTQNSNYLSFFDVYKAYTNKFGLSELDYKLIIRSFFFILKDEMIQTGKVFILPNKLGTFGIKKIKMPVKFRGILDYQHFRKTGERRYLKNLHSEQFMATLHWDQGVKRFSDRMCRVLKITPARELSRELAKHIKEENAISKYYDK
jgi:hypothetical protein